MKSNILKYIFIVSLLMNVSLLGAAAYTHYKQVRSYHTAPFLGPIGTPGPLAPFGQSMLFEELSLKPEQVKLFQQKALLFHGGLVALMRTDNPDNKAIEATIAQINQKQEEMQKTIVSHMIEFKSMLNKDQQGKFMGMIEDAMGERKGPICP